MVSTQLRILRVFGLTSAEVTAILRAAQDDGCPGLRLLERDGEFAVCVQASAPTQAMADEHCDKWAQKLRARFGDAFYGMGEVSLAQATLDALVKKRRLIVAADETTGRLLGALLQPLDHSEAVFDFGTQTYANAANARKIITPPALLKKFPGDVMQAAAGRAQLAMQVGQADYAAVYMPATVGQAPFVLLCDKRGAVACAVSPEMSDAAIGNNILDLARRRALGLKFSQGTIQFRPGHDRPLLLVSQAGQQKPGDTTRFSLRRRRSGNTASRADFEPMLDFDTAQIPKAAKAAAAAAVGASVRAASKAAKTVSKRPVPDNAASVAASAWAAAEEDWNDSAARQPAAAAARGSAPTGTITFETPVDTAGTPRPQASAAQQPAGGDSDGETPLTFTTGGAQAAAAYRAARTAQPRTQPTPRTTVSQNTGTVHLSADAAKEVARARQHSILDDDVPDFTASLDPETIRAAQQADDAEEPRSLEEFQEAAKHLYDSNSPDDVLDPTKNRSLAAIERAERKQRRTMTVVFVIFLLLLAAGAVGLWYYFSHNMGSKPSPKGYGTAQFDENASDYLANAQQKKEGVVGYLAFPGWEGQLVYVAGATAEDAEEPRPQIEGTSYLGSAMPSNTVLNLNGLSLAELSSLDTMRDNAGFTLYLADGTYRYKVLAAYYQDPGEENGFDPVEYGDLSSYSDYLSFVLGAHMRSLYDTDIDVEDSSSFLTLVGTSDVSGVNLCLTGRLIEEDENAQLAAAPIQMQESPLLTAAQYAASGQQAPDMASLLKTQLEWYAGVSTIRTKTASGSGEETDADSESIQPNQEGQPGQTASSTDLSQSIEDLQQKTDNLITSADNLLAGLTDKAGEAGASESDLNQGAEGTLPEQTVSVDSILSTPAPDSNSGSSSSGSSGEDSDGSDSSGSTDSGSNNSGGTDSGSSGGDSSGSQGGSAPQGETINVTMNGTQQTMDLVTCLAMIAQNELGPNAPAEAYKAQCVAAHCWILSQGGYPPVSGATPGAAATAAAQEVARVLVTYNGNVCFTPYFASASKGTASSADVWGGDRAWLVAVDSPYDETTATNWHTNGATSGTARFSRATVQQRIQSVLGIDLSGVDPNNWFKILSANQYGWVTKMQIGPDEGPNTTCRGTWFRETLLAGQSVDGRSLRSQCFTVSYDSGTDCFIFDVYGYGHGCGMSQWGAVGYANNGWSYQDILLHYYPNTSLTTY